MSVSSGRKFSLLPMLGHTKGKRSPVTCALKCDNACSGEVCNTSSNSYFRDIASATMSRRAALGFGAAGALAVAFGGAVTSAEPAVADGGPGLSAAAKNGYGESKLQFTAIAPVDAAVDAFTVPEGFTWQPVIRWGDPHLQRLPRTSTSATRAPPRRHGSSATTTTTPTSSEIPGSKDRRAVLFANHEYTNETIMFPASLPAAEVRAIGAAAHGLSVVELERKNKNKPWSYVQGAGLNRRFLNDTAYELTGPVAGSPLVRTNGRPRRPHHPGHAGQLRRRHHPVGHHPLRRGKLQRVLRRARHLGRGQALRAHQQAHGPPVGTRRSAVRYPHRRLRKRGQPLRLDRGSRSVRSHVDAEEALLAGPFQARGRQRDRGRIRPCGGLLGRRRALRLPLQVRLEGQVPRRRTASTT